MDQRVKPAPHEIRRARADNPKARERDLAAQIGISEAELVAAHCGDGVSRIEPRVNDLLSGLEAVGEVMALTRNESAVHEKIGVYDKVVPGDHNAMVLGENIDLRIFPSDLASCRLEERRQQHHWGWVAVEELPPSADLSAGVEAARRLRAPRVRSC